ncbi:MAG: two-component regulator propeller domain-containing protein [Flavisolibacter sp.]
MRQSLLILMLFPLCGLTQNTIPSIGMWREHLPYQAAQDLTASPNKIYCATPYSLFTIDRKTGEIERISKMSGLSETGINTIRYDDHSGKLFIAYANSNIDVVDNSGIHNIPDLKRKNISGDKNVYDIFPDNQFCYLSTGLGIVLIDALKNEIKDSWLIGENGLNVKTYSFVRNQGNFFAATEEGLKKISVTNTHPEDFHNWQLISGTNGLPSGSCKQVVVFQSKTIALEHDSLFAESNNSWNVFFTSNWSIVSVSASENKLLVCQHRADSARVLVLGTDGSILTSLQNPDVISSPKNALALGNEYWVADLLGGLSHWTTAGPEVFKPNSPADISLGAMTIFNNTVYATAGRVNDSWNYQYNRSGIFRLSDGWWTNYNQYGYALLDSLMDFMSVAVDPSDGTLWAGSFGGGLLHIINDQHLEVLKQNSPLEPAVGDPTSYRVAGLAFDEEGQLWITNFGAGHLLHVHRKDGSWQSFSPPFLVNYDAASQILVDELGQKWIVSPLGNGLLVFNDNHTSNPNDDQWKLLRSGTGNGNLPSNEVLCIAQDKSGFIWIGTSEGIGLIQCPDQIFVNGCEAIFPVIKEGNFANYLFKGQEVRSIAVDGADRKWTATSNGVWLLSPDGDRVINHFTEENSPLLSNDVKNIAVNGLTGEVFFATANGICSFRGTATEASETKNNILVFPNPVPPAYNGTIGIRGLPENGIIKITETNGRLVYQTRSNGGQASWNGKDYTGKQVSSGVYLVLCEEKPVAKIVFVSK